MNHDITITVGLVVVTVVVIATVAYFLTSDKKEKNESKFSKKTSDEIVQNLNSSENLLRKKRSALEKKIEEELKAARANTKNKRVALQALKRKQRYEFQINQIDGRINTLIQQRRAFENATTNREVLNNLYNELHDLAEQNELANEIANVISYPNDIDTQIDDDELLKELEELDQNDI